MISLLLYLIAALTFTNVFLITVTWFMENLTEHVDFITQEIGSGGLSTPKECPYLTAAKKEVEQICS